MNMPVGGFESSMGRLPRQWMWLLMLSALAVGNASACPALCTCSGTTVDCHGLGLKTMPRSIPRNTERLWVPSLLPSLVMCVSMTEKSPGCVLSSHCFHYGCVIVVHMGFFRWKQNNSPACACCVWVYVWMCQSGEPVTHWHSSQV